MTSEAERWVGADRSSELPVAAPAEGTPGTLAPSFFEETGRRLGLISLTMALGNGLALGIGLVLSIVGSGAPEEYLPFRFVQVVMILLGLLVFVLCKSRVVSPRQLLDIGLAFEVVGAYALALPLFMGGDGPVDSLERAPWVCIWLVMFPLVVPGPPVRNVIASFLAASMVPAAYYSGVLAGSVPLVKASTQLFTFLPGYICVVLAIFPAWLMHQMATSISAAKQQLRRLGHYRLVEKLGEGGMGEVWRAEHALLARPAAIKLIGARMLADATPAERQTVVKRFEREARATAALECPHTIQLHDFGATEDGNLFYAMELLTGLDLQTLVDRHGPMPPARVVHVLRQACASLAEAHAADLIHRDIKPANICVCRVGLEHDFVKVLDFGLVMGTRHTDSAVVGATRLTTAGIAVGTVHYMAPEMADGRPDIDGRADIYALGCVGYFLLTGRTVFEGASNVGILYEHINTAARPPSEKAPQREIPPDLDRAILLCLAKMKEGRPQTAEELDRLLAGCDVGDAWTPRHAREWWETHLRSEIDADRIRRAPTEPVTRGTAADVAVDPKAVAADVTEVIPRGDGDG